MQSQTEIAGEGPRRVPLRSARFGLALLSMIWPVAAQERPSPPQLGISFQSTETQALQADETRNPGMLWVEQGAKLWNEPTGTAGKSCASCHGAAETSMKGVAARYPVLEMKQRADGAVAFASVNLEGRINDCRQTQQGATAFTHEANELLGLAAVVAYQSRGVARTPLNYGTGEFRPFVERYLRDGHRLFHTRQGQLNLSCAQCHDDLVGKKLRGDTISQAQTHGWPAYRLEWQTMGSLQRRLRACSLGVRAEVLDYGHPDYLALEFYLAWRGENLPLESPGVRR